MDRTRLKRTLAVATSVITTWSSPTEDGHKDGYLYIGDYLSVDCRPSNGGKHHVKYDWHNPTSPSDSSFEGEAWIDENESLTILDTLVVGSLAQETLELHFNKPGKILLAEPDQKEFVDRGLRAIEACEKHNGPETPTPSNWRYPSLFGRLSRPNYKITLKIGPYDLTA